MSSPTACLYLEHFLMLSPTAEVRPCCRFDPTQYEESFRWSQVEPLDEFYNSELFQKIRRQARAGEKVAGCRRCYEEESFGIPSMRQKPFPGGTPSRTHSADFRFSTTAMEIGVGRVCNLKCRTCNAFFSTKWDEDSRALNLPYPGGIETISLSKIPLEFFENLQSMKITGGEPLLHPEFPKMVQKLTDSSHSQHIDLELFSNATQNPPLTVVTCFKDFRQVDISLSLDGYKDKNTYLRPPAAWDTIEKVVQKWLQIQQSNPNLRLNFAVTVSVYNILSLYELLDWLATLQLPHGTQVIFQIAHDPAFLHVGHLPNSIRADFLKVLNSQKSKFRKSHPHSGLDSGITKVFKLLMGERSSPDLLSEFWRETNRLDVQRNQSFAEAFPETAKLLLNSLEARPLASTCLAPES